MSNWIKVNWPAPLKIHAYVITQQAGDLSLDLNRQDLYAQLKCPPVAWLKQTHSNRIVNLTATHDRNADGAYLDTPDQTAVVMTADCLPLLLCDAEGVAVAAVHCGWKGLQSGIIAEALSHFKLKQRQILAWLGPAISAPYYEVDDKVRDAFIEDKHDIRCFEPNARGRWQASLYQLARCQLNRLGVTQIYGGDRCSYAEDTVFFSYRRGSKTERMASLIWID